jgi:hypothetical protein
VGSVIKLTRPLNADGLILNGWNVEVADEVTETQLAAV